VEAEKLKSRHKFNFYFMKNSGRMNLDAFKLNVEQEGKKVEELMGGLALANCHPTSHCITGPDGGSDPDAC
jgi:hypothetical protein